MEVDEQEKAEEPSSPQLEEEVDSSTPAKRELSEGEDPEKSEDEDATPPPPSERPPEVKRRRFFAKESDDDLQEVDIAQVKDEKLNGNAATNGSRADKGKGKAADHHEVVEILDDSDDDDIILAGPSTARPSKAVKKPYVARDGKDFKGQKYFGSKPCRSPPWTNVDTQANLRFHP